jgi:hypothetical protein
MPVVQKIIDKKEEMANMQSKIDGEDEAMKKFNEE